MAGVESEVAEVNYNISHKNDSNDNNCIQSSLFDEWRGTSAPSSSPSSILQCQGLSGRESNNQWARCFLNEIYESWETVAIIV